MKEVITFATFKSEYVIRKEMMFLDIIDAGNVYLIRLHDGVLELHCEVKKSSPKSSDQTELETTYLPVANKPHRKSNKTTGAEVVSIEKPDDSSTTLISHDWCDPSSWYTESLKVTGKALTIEAGKVFLTGDANIIDLVHGRKTDEDEVSAPYLFKLTDDGIELTEDEDYTVDYKTGKVTIGVGYTVQGTLVADYHKADGSSYIFEPTAGKILILEHPELNFAKDCFINTHVIFEVWVGNPYFNPENPVVEYDPLTSIAEHNCLRFPYKKKVYKNEKDLINAANLGQGFIPKFGNLNSDILVFPFNYVTTTSLRASQLAQLRIFLKPDKDGNNIPLTGSFGTVSFYVISIPE